MLQFHSGSSDIFKNPFREYPTKAILPKKNVSAAIVFVWCRVVRQCLFELRFSQFKVPANGTFVQKIHPGIFHNIIIYLQYRATLNHFKKINMKFIKSLNERKTGIEPALAYWRYAVRL